MSEIPKLLITTGEPAGIGPDIVLTAACQKHSAHLIATGDRALLTERAVALGLDLTFPPYSSTDTAAPHQPGALPLIDIPLKAPCTAGSLAPQNVNYVLAQLDMAVSLCIAGEAQAMVTAPVHKGVINEAGIPFTGHTEYLAAATAAENPLMLLQADDLRVALATTHLPLSAVPGAITIDLLNAKLEQLINGLTLQMGMASPRITVLGLNPHAGENGHLGREEIEVIAPVCEAFRAAGHEILGPASGDTAFLPDTRALTDAYLAMYHDQGLPVLKTLGFHHAVNITLGLPIVRTSVDHGTALSLAGSGGASHESLNRAIGLAAEMAENKAFVATDRNPV